METYYDVFDKTHDRAQALNKAFPKTEVKIQAEKYLSDQLSTFVKSHQVYSNTDKMMDVLNRYYCGGMWSDGVKEGKQNLMLETFFTHIDHHPYPLKKLIILL